MAEHLKTRIERKTLSQEARVFLAPKSYWRRVQLVLPDDKQVFVQEDIPIPSEGNETLPDGGKGWGADRASYKAPPLEGGQQIEFPLAPGQWLVGATVTGVAHITVITNWMEGPTGA